MGLIMSDRKALIRLASTLPKGSKERKAILTGLKKTAADWKRESWKGGSGKAGADVVLKSSINGRVTPRVIAAEWKALQSKINALLKDNDWSQSKGRNDAHALSVSARGSRIEIAVVLIYSGSDDINAGALW